MNKKWLVHAILAEIYIVAIVLLIQYGMRSSNTSDTIFIPIAMISLFVLSAAIMGYFFLSTPIQLYLDGKKTEAISFFVKTTTTFAAITVIAFVVVAIIAHHIG